MAKQQIYQFENGATLIYQKQSGFNGCSFAIGFRAGSQLDGKFKGLSHLLEHLMFRSTKDSLTQNILNNILCHAINQNAFTSQNTICATFTATHNNVIPALQNIMKMMTNRKFSEEQIAKEIEIVKQEIGIEKDDFEEFDRALESLLQSLTIQTKTPLSSLDILGNPRSLKSVTPKLLREYVARYFNSDNLVISVTSNKPVEDIFQLCADHIFPKLSRARSSKYIVPFDNPPEFHPLNGLIAIPDTCQQTVELNILLRERSDYSEDIDKEYAYGVVEGYIMNYFGGILWDALRVKNNLVYSYSLSQKDCGKAKFKVFNATTSSAKMRKTISEICKTIRTIGIYGFPKKHFETVKQVLTDTQNASIQKFETSTAVSNYYGLLSGIPFVDYKKVRQYIQSMTYEEFNEYICEIYRRAEVSLTAYGNFDKRKMYYLVEIEKMLGNETHLDCVENFNTPIAEMTEIIDSERLRIHQSIEEQLDEIEEQRREAEKPTTTPITMDNLPVK